jgi:hypothetical protein
MDQGRAGGERKVGGTGAGLGSVEFEGCVSGAQGRIG